jgi:hypothetical protein
MNPIFYGLGAKKFATEAARILSKMDPNTVQYRAFCKKTYCTLIRKGMGDHLMCLIRKDLSFGTEHVPGLIHFMETTPHNWEYVIRTLKKMYDVNM